MAEPDPRAAPDLDEARARVAAVYPVLAGAADAVGQDLRVQRIDAGRTLFDVGAACAGFPLVLAGGIRVTLASTGGREILLYRVRPGEGCVLSAGALLGQVPHRARGTAESSLEMAVLPPARFEALLDRSPGFRRWVFALQAERLAALMARVAAVAFQPVEVRLAACLLERSASGRVAVRATHQDLADELGTVREIVTRALHRFADAGVVALGRGRLRVLDVAALARRAGR